MIDNLSHAHVYVVGAAVPFVDEVCQAFRRARMLSGMSLDDFASCMSVTLHAPISPGLILDWEEGRRHPQAREYFALCRVADQIQSAVAGETEHVPGIYELERQISDLRAIVEDSLSSRPS